jgi:large subunit ribosomal protein L13
VSTPEIDSEEIGRRTLAFLKTLDDVAYIRFLSVYRDFDSVDRFIEEIRHLGGDRGETTQPTLERGGRGERARRHLTPRERDLRSLNALPMSARRASIAFGLASVGQASPPPPPDRPDGDTTSERCVESMSTYFPKEPQNDWVLVDATGQTVGRLATQIASVLRGKHKPDFTPNQAGGDFVVVVNAEKVVFTGNKLEQKVYTRYTGYPGGLKTDHGRRDAREAPRARAREGRLGHAPQEPPGPQADPAPEGLRRRGAPARRAAARADGAP